MVGALHFDFEEVLSFVRTRMPLSRVEGMTAIGWKRGGRLVAGAIFEGFNGVNIWVHLAGAPGGHWLARGFIAATMRYVFVVCGCRRLSAWVDEGNLASARFVEHFGFREEARLKGAAKDGGDVLIYVLTREACRHAFE
jgi:RimJ/RimL family protein N-acetyltransferase